MARASYQFDVRKDETSGKTTLVIVDNNAGGMSVTNDIENVVEEICLERNLVSAYVDVVYKDSEGRWDGYDPKTRNFIYLGGNNSNDAIAILAKVRKDAAEQQQSLRDKETK